MLFRSIILQGRQWFLLTDSPRRYRHRKYVSQLFQNLQKIPPQDSQLHCKSHKLMIYNDIIQNCHPGGFHLLPLGQRVLEKLIKVIDEELDTIGAQKICMPTLALASLWKKTDRWDSAGAELFRLKDRHKQDYCLGPTHEELVTDLISKMGNNLSYKKLPVKLYQISRKFRDEMHPRHGLLRSREFEMKDLYTFDTTEENAKKTYEEVCQVYENIFNRLGLQFKKVIGATGNIGGKLSHEFLLQSDIGEDTIKVCNSCQYGRNIEVEDPTVRENKCPSCGSELDKMSAIEVGHSFLLGTKYSEILGSTYKDKNAQNIVTQMGCYGLGVTRILQAGIEVLSENEAIRWPKIISPYQICIIPQMKGYMEDKFMELSNKLYDEIVAVPNLRGEVVIDDRTKFTVGNRLSQANRLGYPYVVVIGKSAIDEEPKYELQDIYNKTTDFLSSSQIISKLSQIKTT
ncbi:probable proline--tRNA ligase, mitochondrial isoform X1 [Mytilus edulis]|uniref:probable proline--tRNA ligase, mitochondrial isoform X1 n=1 Tax=Mytilus edulis TaxID=6550 RepID=UPI0039F0A97C